MKGETKEGEQWIKGEKEKSKGRWKVRDGE